jgi:peptidoglycan/xylan/chitin deacetylase (PgdA/CDA1 family)
MKDVLVLCYHAVSERWPAPLSVTPERLEQQLRFLTERGYRGATFEQAVTAPPAKKVVAVTFDDAFRSVFDLAFPILSRLGLPGTLFVPTRLIDGEGPMTWPGTDHWVGGPYEDELIAMSWQEVEQLADAGWEIGSHTQSHPRLAELEQSAIESELRGSREDCERRLGRTCHSLAYPYGEIGVDFDARAIRAAGDVGYLQAATLPGRLHSALPLQWPRVGVYYRDDLKSFRRKVSPRMRWLRASPVWGVIGPAQRALRRK